MQYIKNIFLYSIYNTLRSRPDCLNVCVCLSLCACVSPAVRECAKCSYICVFLHTLRVRVCATPNCRCNGKLQQTLHKKAAIKWQNFCQTAMQLKTKCCMQLPVAGKCGGSLRGRQHASEGERGGGRDWGNFAGQTSYKTAKSLQTF